MPNRGGGEDKSSCAGGNKWIENILQRMDKVSGEACVVKYYFADTGVHEHPHSAAHCLQIGTAAKSRGRRMHRMLEKIFYNLLAYQSRGLNDVEYKKRRELRGRGGKMHSQTHTKQKIHTLYTVCASTPH